MVAVCVCVAVLFLRLVPKKPHFVAIQTERGRTQTLRVTWKASFIGTSHASLANRIYYTLISNFASLTTFIKKSSNPNVYKKCKDFFFGHKVCDILMKMTSNEK